MSIVNGQTIVASDFVSTSAGAGDSGKVAKLGSAGTIHSSFLRRGGTGADGALTISSGTTTLSFASANILEKNYTTISITGTAVLAFSNPATNGSIAILRAQGDVTLTSSATRGIDLRLMGATGAAGYVSGGYICGDGGRGAGGLWIDCGGALNFTAAFTIDASGQNGTNAVNVGVVAGGGGEGGGGSVLITADSITANAGTINTAAGTAGSSVTGGSCTGTNSASSGTDAYANIGTLAGGTGANQAAGTTTAPRFFTTTIVGNHLFLAPGAGGGGGGANGCGYGVGGGGKGASVTSSAGYSLVTTYSKLK